MKQFLLLSAIVTLASIATLDAQVATEQDQADVIKLSDLGLQHDGKEVTVILKITDTQLIAGDREGEFPHVLLWHEDMKNPPYLGVYAKGDLADALHRLSCVTPDDHLVGRSVKATGTIEIFNKGDQVPAYFLNLRDWKKFQVLREPEAQSIPLFNGRDLDAWDQESTSPPDEWEVKDGILSTLPNGSGWLQTVKEYDNFELSLEFRMSEGANSGVFLRADGFTPHKDGLEVQLLDDNDKENPGPMEQACGALLLETGPTMRASRKAGEWQSLRIKCDGTTISVWLNGRRVIHEDLSRNLDRAEEHPGRNRFRGHIGLQNRGERVDFRRIRIRPIP